MTSHKKYGWSFVNYLYTPLKTPKHNVSNFFVNKLKALVKNIQELIIKKLYGGIEIWYIQHTTLVINWCCRVN